VISFTPPAALTDSALIEEFRSLNAIMLDPRASEFEAEMAYDRMAVLVVEDERRNKTRWADALVQALCLFVSVVYLVSL
jgi:hypothetical protein